MALGVKSGSPGRLPRGTGALTPVLAAPHYREGQGGAQARGDFCSRVPGSVPPPSPLSHPVGSRGTGLASPLHSPGRPEIGEAGCFQKWPRLTLDTLYLFGEAGPSPGAFLSEQPLTPQGGRGRDVKGRRHLGCSLRGSPASTRTGPAPWPPGCHAAWATISKPSSW